MNVSDLAREGFAFGYTRTANGAAMSNRTKATCLVITEGADRLVEVPRAPEFILEAGRAEGHRDRRETDHFALYDYHSANLAKALSPILARLDTTEIARQAIEHASAAAQSGSTPVERRRTVASLALAAITASVHADDRTTLDELNADGWAHATAQGQAEAEATPPKGGPPDTAIVGGLALTALARITRDSRATTASALWTGEQLHTISMGVALAAGDGKAVADATRKVSMALVDTGRATATYAMQLHQAVNLEYVDQIITQTPDAQFNFVNGGPDPCDACIAAAIGGPYDTVDLPDCPLHANCFCGIEQTTASVMAGAIA